MKISLTKTESIAALALAKEMGLGVSNLEQGDTLGFKHGYVEIVNEQVEITMFQSSVAKVLSEIKEDVMQRNKARKEMTKRIDQIFNGFEKDMDIIALIRSIENIKSPAEKETLTNECKPQQDNRLRIMQLTQTCSACPSQWEGMTDDGKHLYIRYRWGNLEVKMGETNDIGAMKTILEKNFDITGLDGALSTRQLVNILSKEQILVMQ